MFFHGLASVANSLHALGFIIGQLEVGGANAGILAGVSNQIANVAGTVLPMIAATLRLHTGGAWGGSLVSTLIPPPSIMIIVIIINIISIVREMGPGGQLIRTVAQLVELGLLLTLLLRDGVCVLQGLRRCSGAAPC